jgi:hypothetical protein
MFFFLSYLQDTGALDFLITPFLHIFHEPAEKESNINQVIALEKIKTVQKNYSELSKKIY